MHADVLFKASESFRDTVQVDAISLSLEQRFGENRCLSSNGLASVWWVQTAEGPVVVKAFALNQQSAYRREAAVAFGISDPSVVRCLDTFLLNCGHSCLTYEYLSSGSVADLAAQTRLHDTLVRQIAIQSLQGLAALHAKGYVHCDVKPANILGGRYPGHDGIQFKIADLGSAATLKEAKSGRHGTGSPAYCAPERLYSQFDFNSDLYSVGVMVFELLCGHLPFMGNVEEIYRAHISRQAPLADIRSERWREWLSRLLAKAPRDRFASANEALEVLPYDESAVRESGHSADQRPVGTIFISQSSPADVQVQATGSKVWSVSSQSLPVEKIYLPYEIDCAASASGLVVLASHRGLMRWRPEERMVSQLSAAAPPCLLAGTKLLFSAAHNIISLDILANKRHVLMECDAPVLALALKDDWIAVAQPRKVFVQRISTGEIGCALRHKHYALEPLLAIGADLFALSGGLGNHELWIRKLSGDISRHIVGKGPWLAIHMGLTHCTAICAPMGAGAGRLEMHRILHDGPHHVEPFESSGLDVALSENLVFYRDLDSRLAWLSSSDASTGGLGPEIGPSSKLYVDQEETAVIVVRNAGQGCEIQRLVLMGEGI